MKRISFVLGMAGALGMAGVVAVIAGLAAAPALADRPFRAGGDSPWDPRYDRSDVDRPLWAHRHDERRWSRRHRDPRWSRFDDDGENRWRHVPRRAWAQPTFCPPGLAKKDPGCQPPGQVSRFGPAWSPRPEVAWRRELRAALWRLPPPPGYD